jgi:hypothetical protein
MFYEVDTKKKPSKTMMGHPIRKMTTCNQFDKTLSFLKNQELQAYLITMFPLPESATAAGLKPLTLG